MACTLRNEWLNIRLASPKKKQREPGPMRSVPTTGLSLHVPVSGHPGSAVKSTITAVRSVMTRLGRLVTAMAKDRDRSWSYCVCRGGCNRFGVLLCTAPVCVCVQTERQRAGQHIPQPDTHTNKSEHTVHCGRSWQLGRGCSATLRWMTVLRVNKSAHLIPEAPADYHVDIVMTRGPWTRCGSSGCALQEHTSGHPHDTAGVKLCDCLFGSSTSVQHWLCHNLGPTFPYRRPSPFPQTAL